MTSLPAAYKNQGRPQFFSRTETAHGRDLHLFLLYQQAEILTISFLKSPRRDRLRSSCAMCTLCARRAQKSRPLCALRRSTKRPAAPVEHQHIKKLSSFSIRRRSSTKATIQPLRPPIKSGRPRENTVLPEAANSALTKVTARKTSALIHAPP